jgi:hypothetical protein
MTAVAAEKREARWIRTLEAPHTLADDLGAVGEWVGPRKGPFKRDHGQKEDYVLRRLLVAWRETGRLRFPVEVQAACEGEAPDFMLTWSDGTTLGVEHTEAGDEQFQRWMTATENSDETLLFPRDGSTPQSHANEIQNAIRKKAVKAYGGVPVCDLLVYDNTQSGAFSDEEDIKTVLARLGRPNDLVGCFRQVHIVFGNTVCLDALAKPEFVDVSMTYEIDFAKWIADQVKRLARNEPEGIDFHNIIEELESLGRSERRALASHFRNLLFHLLKWEFQPQRRSNSWKLSIDLARDEIFKLVTESPSLKHHLRKLPASENEIARRLASTETSLPIETFPKSCPYNLTQVLDPEFLPGEPE